MELKAKSGTNRASRKAATAGLALALWLAASCTGQGGKPANLLPEATYENLFIETRMLGVYVELTGDSLRAGRLADSLWAVYGVDRERFLASHAWYERDVTGQKRRLQRLADSLSALDTRLSTIE